MSDLQDLEWELVEDNIDSAVYEARQAFARIEFSWRRTDYSDAYVEVVVYIDGDAIGRESDYMGPSESDGDMFIWAEERAGVILDDNGY